MFILSQFHEGHVIHIRHFQYGQDNERKIKRKLRVPLLKGVISQCPIVELCKKLAR